MLQSDGAGMSLQMDNTAFLKLVGAGFLSQDVSHTIQNSKPR